MMSAARVYARRRKVWRFGRIFIPVWIGLAALATLVMAADVLWPFGWGARWQDVLLGLGMVAFPAVGRAVVHRCFSTGAIGPMRSVELYGQLGAVDAAYSTWMAEKNRTRHGRMLPTSAFLSKGTGALRRDARFVPLMKSVGLADYWRSTGNWPDFCREPGLPFDCRSAFAAQTVVR